MKPDVLIVIDTAAVGGPGKGVLQLLRRVAAADARLSVATFFSSRHRSSEFIERVKADGREMTVLREKRRLDPSVFRQAALVVRTKGINLLQSHGYKAHFLCAVLRRLLNVPWLAVVNGYTSENLKVKLYNSLDRLTLRYCDAVAAVSPGLCENAKLICGGKQPVYHIPNAVDVDDLQGAGSASVRQIRQRCAPGGELLLGIAGRLSPEKGQKFFLDSFTAIRHGLPSCRVLLIGDGPQRKELEEMVKTRGLDREVIFEGYQSKMRDYFEALDLLMLPSFFEGLPNVVLEAMVCRLPVVASAVGGVPELIENGKSGWLFEPGDHRGLQQCLQKALAADRRRRETIAAEAYRTLFPRYCPFERAKRFVEVYNRLISVASKDALFSAPSP